MVGETYCDGFVPLTAQQAYINRVEAELPSMAVCVLFLIPSPALPDGLFAQNMEVLDSHICAMLCRLPVADAHSLCINGAKHIKNATLLFTVQ